jgi:hypothetical protein
MLIHLIYGSSATRDLSKADLVDILNTARENNKRLNVTGMLLFKDGNFMQVLEGEAETVDALYQRIKRDPRHHQILLISRRPVESRNFGEWEMAFSNLDELDPAALEGYSDFLSAPQDSFANVNESIAHSLLLSFRDTMR